MVRKVAYHEVDERVRVGVEGVEEDAGLESK